MQKRKRALFLTNDGLTDPLGQSQIFPYLRGLSSTYDITIISCDKKDRYGKTSKEVQAKCDAAGITWYSIPYLNKPPLVGTLLNLSKMRKLVLQLYKKSPFDIVHCRSYLVMLVGIYLKKRKPISLIFDMRGFWADERRDTNQWADSHPLYSRIYNFFKKKEKEFLQLADHIVSLTENAKKEIQSWDITEAPITVIPTCVDLSLFDPSKVSQARRDEFKQQLGPSDFVLLYLGSWGPGYLPSETIQIFGAIRRKIPSAKFLIVTNNPSDVPKIDGSFVVSSKRDDVPVWISLANASLFFIIPTFSKKASAATKMGELLAMNSPIVTNSGWGDATEIIEREQCGVVIKDLSVRGFEKAADEIINTRANVNLRAVATAYFDLEKGIQRYREIYASL